MGDLQKGEQYLIILLSPVHYFNICFSYVNMDWIIFSSLTGSITPSIMFSYDICCQWSRNLKNRVKQLLDYMQIPPAVFSSVHYVLPKFHIYNHSPKCQAWYLMNFLPGMGWFNGEDPEHWWAHINPLSMSTQEMGAGSRTDTIDNHALAWNWQKIVNFGKYIFMKQCDLH